MWVFFTFKVEHVNIYTKRSEYEYEVLFKPLVLK